MQIFGVATDMRKTSAITFSVLIMLVVLAVLLGLTAFFIDQSVVYPLVLMQDTEVTLKCFLSLINLNSQGYIRQGEVPPEFPENSLRNELLKVYNIEEVVTTKKDDSKLQILGYSGIFTGNYAEFLDLMQDANFKIMCYTRSFGPANKGYIAIYRRNV